MNAFQNPSLLDIYAGFFGSQVAIAPEYLVVTLFIAFIIYKYRHVGTGFWVWALPKNIYGHASCKLDIKLFVVGQLMALFGLINKVTFSTIIASAVAGVINIHIDSKILENPLVIAGIIFLLNDFVAYWLHRFYHQTPAFWPLHSVHHSAEVLTPITTYRHHPLSVLISYFVNSIFYGLLQGVFMGIFVKQFQYTEVVGINVFYFTFLLIVNNFHHSHIWVSFGRFWGCIFISPAQHHIHHSLDPCHHNKNYGQFLALWDALFGTLYNPKTYEKISVGIADAKGLKLPQRHRSLIQAVIVPISDIWKENR
ncbi:MAG: sterol desaturase family protein [Rhodobacterales bacterium]